MAESTSLANWTIENKVCIVTGSNSGIGRVTALELVKRGAAKVILACRNVVAAEEAAKYIVQQAGLSDVDGKSKVVAKHLDVSSLESVRRFAHEINATEPALHVLVNNAGLESPERKTSPDGFELTFATNHLGPFYLTNCLLDLLKKSAPSRVVVVASVMYKATWPRGFDLDDVNQERAASYSGNKAYCQSKLANILFARELHRRLNDEGSTHHNRHHHHNHHHHGATGGVSVFAVHPGMTNSNFLRQRTGFDRLFGELFFVGAVSVEQGASTSLYCATEPGIERYSGQYFTDKSPRELWAIARDDEKARRLWELSHNFVSISLK